MPDQTGFVRIWCQYRILDSLVHRVLTNGAAGRNLAGKDEGLESVFLIPDIRSDITLKPYDEVSNSVYIAFYEPTGL